MINNRRNLVVRLKQSGYLIENDDRVAEPFVVDRELEVWNSKPTKEQATDARERGMIACYVSKRLGGLATSDDENYELYFLQTADNKVLTRCQSCNGYVPQDSTHCGCRQDAVGVAVINRATKGFMKELKEAGKLWP